MAETIKQLNLDDLKKQGYSFSGEGRCSNCNEEIEWWFSPKRKPVPFNPMPSGRTLAIHHSTTCGKDI